MHPLHESTVLHAIAMSGGLLIAVAHWMNWRLSSASRAAEADHWNWIRLVTDGNTSESS
jgi:hypothetical protein